MSRIADFPQSRQDYTRPFEQEEFNQQNRQRYEQPQWFQPNNPLAWNQWAQQNALQQRGPFSPQGFGGYGQVPQQQFQNPNQALAFSPQPTIGFTQQNERDWNNAYAQYQNALNGGENQFRGWQSPAYPGSQSTIPNGSFGNAQGMQHWQYLQNPQAQNPYAQNLQFQNPVQNFYSQNPALASLNADIQYQQRYANAAQAIAAQQAWNAQQAINAQQALASQQNPFGFMQPNFGQQSPLAQQPFQQQFFGQQNWGHARNIGRGPRNFRRSDQRIEEEVNEQLTRNPFIDAEDVTVTVKEGSVTLAGTVDSRQARRLAEDIAENVFGVRDVHNQIRASQTDGTAEGRQADVKRQGQAKV